MGISISRGGPTISHLLFADDCLMFFKAEAAESQCLKGALEASGQLINFDKSAINFSKNVSNEMKDRVKSIFAVDRNWTEGNYLGLPAIMGRNKREILGYLKNKIVSRIRSWNHKYLSKASRKVLLKTVIQAIPSYAMSVFLLPKDLVKEMEKAMNSYRWRGGCDD